MAFIDQIKGANTSLTCYVFFDYSLDGSLPSIVVTSKSPPSYYEYNQSGLTVYELLKTFPSIKESINIETKKYWDLQPEKLNSYGDKALDGMNDKITQKLDTIENLRSWMLYYMKWFYNEEHEDKKLQREIIFLHHYLKGNNCDYRIHNSLQDSLGDIKDKINYITFQDDDYKGEDNWNKFLMWQMKYIDNEDFNQNEKYRKPTIPYGKRFCHGHPSPNANKELCERIFKDLK